MPLIGMMMGGGDGDAVRGRDEGGLNVESA